MCLVSGIGAHAVVLHAENTKVTTLVDETIPYNTWPLKNGNKITCKALIGAIDCPPELGRTKCTLLDDADRTYRNSDEGRCECADGYITDRTKTACTFSKPLGTDGTRRTCQTIPSAAPGDNHAKIAADTGLLSSGGECDGLPQIENGEAKQIGLICELTPEATTKYCRENVK